MNFSQKYLNHVSHFRAPHVFSTVFFGEAREVDSGCSSRFKAKATKNLLVSSWRQPTFGAAGSPTQKGACAQQPQQAAARNRANSWLQDTYCFVGFLRQIGMKITITAIVLFAVVVLLGI